jgi:hypothetical protein
MPALNWISTIAAGVAITGITVGPRYACAQDLASAGVFAAPQRALSTADMRQKALAAEAANNPAEALTAWERLLDRTPASEDDIVEAHKHIHLLRPKVARNTNPAKARKWHVLAVVFRHLDFQWTNEAGTLVEVHKTVSAEDEAKIRKSLAAFKAHVLKYTSGQLDLDLDIQTVEEPLTKLAGDAAGKPPFSPAPHLVIPTIRQLLQKRTYDTVMAYVKFNGDQGPSVPAPFTAATYGRLPDMQNAGFIMVPWHTNYPYPGETDGEMELHEWLHQMQTVFVDVLRYPQAVTANPDGGRAEGDQRPGGDMDYGRPTGETTWIHFYQHIIEEHYTRQMWSEVATSLPADTKAPGEILKGAK